MMSELKSHNLLWKNRS